MQPGNSQIHPRKPYLGGLVVHLTTDSTGQNTGIINPAWMKQLSDFDTIDRNAIRITVEVDKKLTPRFIDYAAKHNAPPTWIPHIQKETGGPISPWRLHLGPIPASQWLAIHDMRTGQPLKMVADIGQAKGQPSQGK